MLYIHFLPFVVLIYWILPHRFAFCILFISVYFLSSMRTGYGPDYYSYQEAFIALRDNPIDEWKNGSLVFHNQELVFRLFGSILKGIKNEYRVYLLIISLMIVAPILLTLNSYSKKSVLPIFIYLTFFYQAWAFSGLRQGLALSLSFYAFYSIALERRIIKNLIIILVAICFHLSAVVSLLCFPFLMKAYHSKKYIFFIFSLVIFALTCNPVIYEFINLTIFADRVNFYIDKVQPINELKILWRSCLFLSVAYFFLRFSRRLTDFEKKVMQFFLTFLPIYLALNKVEIVSAQVSLYPMFLLCFVPSIIYKYLNLKILRTLFLIVVTTMSCFYFYSVLNYTIFASVNNLTRNKDYLIKNE